MKRVLCFLGVMFSFAFIIIGYAVVSDTIYIDGSASITPPPRGVVITDIEVVDVQNVADAGSGFILPTNVRSAVNASRAGSITYKITVENNTDVTYWYRESICLIDAKDYQNGLIGQNNGISIVTKDKLTDTLGTFNSEDWVPPHTVREFYAIYSFGSGALGSPVSTLVNFSFGEKMTSYGEGFLAILNNPDKYAILSGEFNDIYIENGSTQLANVGADKAFFDTLFGTNLTLDGKNVTLVIQRTNVDGKTTGDAYLPSGPSGCEYTIYVTTEDATTGQPTVYAVSYTKAEDGTWIEIGELYEGTVDIGTYTDSQGQSHSFMDVESWEAVNKIYTVFTYNGQSVTYKVNEEYGNSYQQQKKIEELMSMKDQELYNQLNNHQILKDIYKIIFETHVGSTAPEILLLIEAYDDAMRYYEMRNGGQEFRLDDTATRAELLATVEALAKAIDYYNQVHNANHS